MVKQNNIVVNGTLVWKNGRIWSKLEPNTNNEYLEENIKLIGGMPPDGIVNYNGKGSFRKTFQFIGNPVSNNIDFKITSGWLIFHVTYKDNQLKVDIDKSSGKNAVTKRWALEHSLINQEFNYNLKDMQNQNCQNTSFTNNLESISRGLRRCKIVDKANWDLIRSETYIRDKGICWVCNEFVLLNDYDLGHLVDRMNGGIDDLSNCAVMHKHCNTSKPRHKTLEEAMLWRLKPNIYL